MLQKKGEKYTVTEIGLGHKSPRDERDEFDEWYRSQCGDVRRTYDFKSIPSVTVPDAQKSRPFMHIGTRNIRLSKFMKQYFSDKDYLEIRATDKVIAIKKTDNPSEGLKINEIRAGLYIQNISLQRHLTEDLGWEIGRVHLKNDKDSGYWWGERSSQKKD